MYNILILGYYDKFNIGDDCFKIAFREFISEENNLIFINPCLQKNSNYLIPENIDCVIVGGGDIVNIYFLRSIFELIQRSNYRKKVHGISIGITFPEILEKQYLKIFDMEANKEICQEEVILIVFLYFMFKFFFNF